MTRFLPTATLTLLCLLVGLADAGRYYSGQVGCAQQVKYLLTTQTETVTETAAGTTETVTETATETETETVVETQLIHVAKGYGGYQG